MRLFVGIPLASKVTAELSAVCEKLRSDGDALRWSAPDSWHVTLQFLGNTEQERYSCVVGQLRSIQLPSISLHLESMGFFDRAGIFYVDVQLTPGLISLQQRVTTAMGHCGFPGESRPYHPHITLARSKGKARRGLHALKARIQGSTSFSSWIATAFVLYESLLGPDGSRYAALERFSLPGR